MEHTRALDEILAPFRRERTWLLPALQAVQAGAGWLSADALGAVARHLRVPESEVYGVATHYPELRLRPRGRHLVRVCTGVPCRVTGGLDLLRALETRLGVAVGGTTGDGEVTLEEADCCFVCSVAPVVEVDHRHLAGPSVDRVLGACQGPPAPSHAATPPDVVSGHTAGGLAPSRGSAVTGGARARLDALVAAAETSPRPALRLVVGCGSCGLARGAGDTFAALRQALGEHAMDAQVVDGACNGLCHAAPVVEVLRPDAPRLTVLRVTPERVPALRRLLAGAVDHGLEGAAWSTTAVAGLPPVARHPVLGSQSRLVSERWGVLAPADLRDALRLGSYRALADALDAGDPGRVTEAVKAAGLLGRGGAYFPVAQKWDGCRQAAGAPKYVVVNGEEGEPGIFKDRHVMEADPHRLLEGTLLAAWAVGASHGVLFIHGEADLSAARCAEAVGEARAAGLLGESVLGSGFAFDVEIRRGAGGFVLGEETALLESIEGRRAMPRTKPPFPVEAGLHGRPTVVNNVETLSAVPLIVGGRPEAAQAKLYGLSGHVARPGVVELTPPVTLRRLVEQVGGGPPGGRALGAIVIGGPSGIVVSPALLDTPLERPGLSPGTGGITVLDGTVPIADVVRTLLAFNMRESCGKCTPCREGTARLLGLLDHSADAPLPAPGADRAGIAAVPAGETTIRELAEVVRLASLCGLGQAAPLALLSALEHFPSGSGVESSP